MPHAILGNGKIHEILVRRIDEQKQSVGIAVGVVEPAGRRVVSYGNLAKGDSQNVNGDTIFEIGSITKVFTSLLLADMVTRHEVSLDDPAAKYLPESVTMPKRNSKPITLLHLSTHSSGLPPLPTNMKPKDPANPYASYGVDVLYEFLSTYTLTRDPGSQFEYSNLGAGLLGHILALRAGTDYENLIRIRITAPLGMPDTGITLSPAMQQRMATGHNMLLEPVPNWGLSALAGAGALRSSANDMLTFLEAFLGYQVSPLAPAMNLMFGVRRQTGQTKFEIGLGWLIFAERASHDGGTAGFASFTGYDPKARAGVVVLSNAFALPGIGDIGIHLLNPKVPLANPEPPKQHTGIQIDPEILDCYIGRYQSTDRIFEITRGGSSLRLQGFSAHGIGGPKFELIAETENTFVSKMTGSRITFEVGRDGQAISLFLHRPGREPTRVPRLS